VPLFGKFWSAYEIRATIEELRIAPLEMPPIPFEQDYAWHGRHTVVGRLDAARFSTAIEMFRGAAALCDAYRTKWELPLALRTDGEGGLSASHLLEAARYRCIWNHLLSMLRLAADFAVGISAMRVNFSYARTGAVGSARWDRARDTLLAFASAARAKGKPLATMRDEFDVVLVMVTDFTKHEFPHHLPPMERAARLFDPDLDDRPVATSHELCSCGCGVRTPIA